MLCLFINLDAAADRRKNIESSFHRAAPQGWRLERVRATTVDEVQHVRGRIALASKACFMSHRRAVERALQDAGDVLIVEDDTAFSHRGLQALQNVVSANAAWDLLMTDLGILKAGELVTAARQRERYETVGGLFVGNLASVFFIAASAYVVRQSAKRKLLDLIDRPSLDLPYDVVLRELTHGQQLAGRFCIPFLTTLAPDAAASQINPTETTTVATLNAFRRLMFIDRDTTRSAAEIDALQQRVSPTARLYGQLFSGVVGGD